MHAIFAISSSDQQHHQLVSWFMSTREIKAYRNVSVTQPMVSIHILSDDLEQWLRGQGFESMSLGQYTLDGLLAGRSALHVCAVEGKPDFVTEILEKFPSLLNSRYHEAHGAVVQDV